MADQPDLVSFNATWWGVEPIPDVYADDTVHFRLDIKTYQKIPHLIEYTVKPILKRSKMEVCAWLLASSWALCVRASRS